MKNIVLRMLVLTMVISATAMLASCFMGNQYIFAFGITQFVIVVFGSVAYSLRRASTHEAIKYNNEKYDEAVKSRNYIKIVAYGSALPAVVVGLLAITVLIIVAWTTKI